MSRIINSNDVWSKFYSVKKEKAFYPESFLQRIFLSTSPIRFINKEYKGAKMLDVGCGYGKNIPFLNELGFDITGLELSSSIVNNLYDTFPQHSFKKGSFSNIPFDDNTFDFVLGCNSFYYIDDIKFGIEPHFTETARVLKSGGKFIFTFLGDQHSIFNNARKIERDYFEISNDFLNFRNGIIIYKPTNIKDILSYSSSFISPIYGELIEKVKNYIRHIYFIVLTKS